MGASNNISVALRFAGPDLDPDELTRLLGAEPSQSRRAGEGRRLKDGTIRQLPPRLMEVGQWLRAVRRDDGVLDQALIQLFSEMNADPSVWTELTQRYKADVFCGLFMSRTNDGFWLEPASLRLLADRNLKLDLDIYAPLEGEDDQPVAK